MSRILKILLTLVLMIFLLINCKEKVVETDVKPWIGKWNSVHYTDSSGSSIPWIGLYHYYEDGTFSSQGLSPSRDILESDAETLEEYKSLFDYYRAGYGTYSVDEEKGILTYEYTSNLRSHRVKQPTNIRFEVKGDSLILMYEEMDIQILLIR